MKNRNKREEKSPTGDSLALTCFTSVSIKLGRLPFNRRRALTRINEVNMDFIG